MPWSFMLTCSPNFAKKALPQDSRIRVFRVLSLLVARHEAFLVVR